jgi:prefoldin subunit 5
MFEIITPIGSAVCAFLVAFFTTRSKISREDAVKISKEAADEAVKSFKHSVQVLEDEWHDTFERLRLKEARIQQSLKREERALKKRHEEEEIADIFKGATPVDSEAQAVPQEANGGGDRAAQRDALFKRIQGR